MNRFGKVDQVYIPLSDGFVRSSKIAIVRYKKTDEASRAVEEREVNIEYSVVQIQRAVQRLRP